MVASADSDPVLIEHGGDVMGMDVADREADDTASIITDRPIEPDARNFLQAGESVGQQSSLMLPYGCHPDRLQIVDRGSQSDRVSHARCSSLEAGWYVTW
jgi:hypothetical protein